MTAQIMVVDDVWVSVGSANFGNRSFELNDEANLNICRAIVVPKNDSPSDRFWKREARLPLRLLNLSVEKIGSPA